MSSDLVPLPPKVPINRRAAAFAIDWAAVSLISLLLGTNWFVQTIFFIILWLLMRVFLPVRNQGQSLGHWALNITVIETRLFRIPTIQQLVRREGILGIGAALSAIALTGLTSRNAAVILLILPLLFDCGLALVDTERYQQAFHDRFAQTIIIGTRRGYSLDIKLRKMLDQMQRNVR